ncbi:MAG TPA: NAD(P)H-hydrate dehydratase [Terriglobales bacterium]|nr:NAD(P)H-hydrate dehydratase [Terriglobales bacterium]
MKIVTAAEMREIDRLTTEQYGVPSLTLMENAGSAVAEFAQKHFEFKSVCVVCGKGNNGGDGFVAARKLLESGKQVAIIVLAKSAGDLRGDAAAMFKKLPVAPLWASEESDFAKPEVQQALQAELIVDSILGTGFKPPLQGLGRTAVEMINECDAQVLAVDVPSGAYTDSLLPRNAQGLMAKADAIVTFTAPKLVHVFGPLTAGPIAVAPIGTEWRVVDQIARSLELQAITSAHVAAIFQPREPDAHKGDFGHVLVVGGSVGKAGAAAMAGIAALRTGAGLVTVASPQSVQRTVASFAPELMTEPLPETAEGSMALAAVARLQRLLDAKDVVVLGPGLSRHPETAQAVREILPKIQVPVVVDADGLNAFERHAGMLNNESGLILTPHPGEMARITGSSVGEDPQARLQVAREVARKHKAIVVLKGHRTLIASQTGEVWVNTSGNPGMAKGGSGDILSGMIAAAAHQMSQGGFSISSQSEEMKELLRRREASDQDAQKILEERFHDAMHDWAAMIVATAVRLHGLAGDLARDSQGEHSVLASDIAENIGAAISLCRNEATGRFLYLQR